MERSRKNQHHSLEKKIELVNRFLSGESVKNLSVEQNISKSVISYWVDQFKKNGLDGLLMRNNNYSPKFKKEIILKVLNGDLSSYRASIEYCISKGAMEKWVKKAREYGLNALTINGQSNSISQSMYQSKKNSSRLLTREEELLQENEYLRAENAFLKKLKALVDERVAREKKSTRKSSNN